MTTDYHLCFLRQKLMAIKTASMLNLGNQPLKLPNDIVTLLKADDNGQLWFACHKPRGEVRQYEQNFPARLFFYQKGVEYYVEAKGVAFIAGHEDQLQFRDQMAPDTILVKMTPQFIEFTETGTRPSVFTKWYTTVRNWFAKNVPVYHLSKS